MRLVRRMGLSLLMLLLTATLTFFLVRVMPGSPMDAQLLADLQQGMSLAQAQAAVAAEFGVPPHEPLFLQYVQYLWNLLHGRLGNSLVYAGTPALAVILRGLPWTLFTVASSLLLSFILGVALGTVLAYVRDSALDRILSVASSVLHGIPNYVIAMVLVYAVALRWGILPRGGDYGLSVTPGFNLPFLGSVLRHAILPIAAYTLPGTAGWVLLMRSSVVSVLGATHILAAEARGVSAPLVLSQYVARNAILPLFTQFVLSLAFMFSGSIFVEEIFSYPGMGYYFVNAISQLDYPVMQAAFLLISTAVILANLLADLLYARLDPRVEAEL
jgi:peptide/nickel transport system permease protein